MARTPWSPPSDRFLGREDELSRLAGLFAPGAPIALVGPGGGGKTRLVREFLQARRAPAGGVVFAHLERVVDADGLRSALAAALNVLDADPLDAAALTGALAARGPCAVVLDGCERLEVPLRALVPELLAGAPDAVLLLTSRLRLGLPGEVLVEVGPLADAEDAAALLLDRAGRARPGFEPTEADREAATGIAALLDGVPLALELAAGRSGLLGLVPLLARMRREGSIGLLSPGGAAAGRHGALEASIAASWELLDPADREVLAGCSVFAGALDAPAAEAVLGGPGVLDALQRLLDCSLLRPIARAGAVRFRLLGAVREFAARELERSGDAPALQETAAAWFAAEGLAHAAAVDGPEPGPALAWLRDERAQLALVVRHGRPVQQIAAARALGTLLLREGPIAEGLALVELAGPDPATRLLRGRLLLALGRPEEAGSLAEEVGATLLQAEVARARGRIRQARDLARAAVEESMGADLARASLLLARLSWLRGRRDEALERAAEALDQAREAGAVLLGAEVAAWLGRAEAERGRPRQGRALLRPAAARFAEAGDRRARIAALAALGRCEQALGERGAAAAWYAEAVELARELGAAADEARVRMDLAEVALADAREEAEPLLEQALEAARRAGDAGRTWRARADLALVAWGDGRLDEAEPHLRAAARVAEEAGDSRGRLEVAALTGGLAAVAGQEDEATAAFDRIDELLEGTTLAAVPARVVVLRSLLDPGRFGAILAEARAMSAADLGSSGRPSEPRLGRLLEIVRSAVAEPAWRAAWSELLDPRGEALLAEPSGAAFRPPGGDWVELGDGSQLARLLAELLIGDLHTAEDLREALWPGERMAFQSAMDRVYQAVRRLRRAGLDPCLERVEGGYRLSGEVVLLP